MPKEIEQIKELVYTLNKHRDAYYNQNSPTISDKEYDRLFDELKRLEERSGFILSNSPTRTVGYYPISALPKMRHSIPLRSLDKTKQLSELASFIARNPALIMLKLDGLTTKLVYEDGKLISGSTRGDSEVGEEITHNIPSFRNVPLTIPYQKRLVIVGESYIHTNDFDRLKETLQDSNGRPYHNARNLASGGVRNLNPKACAERCIYFSPFNVLEGMEEIPDSDSRQIRLAKVKELGFDTCPYATIEESAPTETQLETCIDSLKAAAQREHIPIDGIVVIFDSLSYSKSCGYTGHHNKEGLAYKFEDEQYETILREIEWTPTRFGEIAPVAIFDTVEIDGCEVSRASLHNLTFIKDLELIPGCRIMVSKRNMIIPHIEENLDRGRYTNPAPPICPCCGSATRTHSRQSSDGRMVETVHCDNPLCDTQILRKFEHFTSKKAMNIENISRATLDKFLELGYLQSFQDIYHLDQHREAIIQLDGFGEKSFDRLWSSIQNSRNTTFIHFLVSMDIPMIGSTKSRVLNRVFRGNLDALEAAACGSYDFTELEDFGDVLNNNLHTWFADEDNLCLWRELQMEMNFEKEIDRQVSENPFQGCTIVATGKLTHFTRDDINEKILALGGKPGSSVSKKTDYLICGEKAGSKLTKAQELGIHVLTEQEFLDMIA
ncbi:MAG: NAD-dependent DNA ligase LigA [Eubacteriales bacterium]|nr:NAD-dependent DNA ligase LigA [Eubacteriales bacterium]